MPFPPAGMELGLSDPLAFGSGVVGSSPAQAVRLMANAAHRSRAVDKGRGFVCRSRRTVRHGNGRQRGGMHAGVGTQ